MTFWARGRARGLCLCGAAPKVMHFTQGCSSLQESGRSHNESAARLGTACAAFASCPGNPHALFRSLGDSAA